ncbi:hypothetical protein O181_007391 [Austropuccinia psidii MF-1]|uniref:Uncharacterized protein n=1 Tax=Austropuccinia psidii MF-1 TaxID=1389203 RepID=A0A9Q3BMQ3_9BASI|nr:hypothetical protein [Austropuccinia psidii MF-1]
MSQRDTLQRSYGNHQRMESQQEVQTPGGEVNQDKGKSSHYPIYRRTIEPDRAYSDSFRLTGSIKSQLSIGFKPFRKQKISGQESPFFTIPGSFQEKSKIKRKKSLLSATGRNKKFDELHRRNKILKELTTLHQAKIKAIQESCPKSRKASEETHKILNQVFEEHYHRKRNRDYLDQDINKLFNICQNMKTQSQGHSLDNPYQEEIKPYFLLDNEPRFKSQYQDGDNMTYSEKEELKQLLEASSWPEFSCVGRYDHMELIDYIYGLFIDVPSIQDYWITARLKASFKGHASIWYTEMKEIHCRRS